MTTDSVPDGHKIIQEGLAKILYPADEDGDVPVSTPPANLIGPRRPRCWSALVQFLNFLHKVQFQAFYNPAQVFNRDLSCAVLEEFGFLLKEERKNNQDIKVIEALSASGLRACRYSLECEGIEQIIANDLRQS